MARMLAIPHGPSAVRPPLAAERPQPALRPDAGEGDPACACSAVPPPSDPSDLPLPAEDGRASARMLGWTVLAGLGFWATVALLAF